MFSPACWRPVKYSAIFQPCPVETMPLVNTPVRSSARFALQLNTRMLVSSLCTTSPCAACRINSSRAGLSNSAASSTISHWVAAGNGIPS